MYNIEPKYTNNYIQLSLPVGNIQYKSTTSNNSISKITFVRSNP